MGKLWWEKGGARTGAGEAKGVRGHLLTCRMTGRGKEEARPSLGHQPPSCSFKQGSILTF